MSTPFVQNQTGKMSNGQPIHGEQTTHDDPNNTKGDQLSDDDQGALIQIVRQYKQSWFLRRRLIIRRVLKAYEFFKGNHFIYFDPESMEFFDALSDYIQQNSSENEDINLYQFATNFYQMLGFAFVAALSSQTPKTRFFPENAEREQDIATAKAAGRVQEINERQNHIKTLCKQGLLFLWMAGCYFRHTRYIVDGDRAGFHKEPVVKMQDTTLLPERYMCSSCGQTSSVKQVMSVNGLRCPKCKAKLNPNDFYPEETAQIPVQVDVKDAPNGMTAQTLYSPLFVDAAPYAKNLRETPILNVDEEVDLSSLRESYPKQWDALGSAYGLTSPEDSQARVARMAATSEAGSRSSFIQDLQPTLSRTWIQPWAFNACADKEIARKLKKKFPKGCLLVNVDDLFLEAREARLEDEWTWCGTIQETFGLYPPAVGDSAIPVQERINDVANITHEYMDRIAAGMVLYNSNLIDGEALNGKPMLPGVLNGVKFKTAASAMGNRLGDAIMQIKSEIDANIYSYQERLVFVMQLLVGTPPQIFGGGGDPHIETASGQSQQLSTAMGKLGLFWDNLREENASAAELAVECTARNATDDLLSVITDQSGNYRNQYVRLDEMRGNVHAYPETDQGMPMSFSEIKAFWEKLIQFGSGGKNPYVNAVMDDPTNQEQIATWTGVPGLVTPGKDMRNKVLRVIDMLMRTPPHQVPAVDPHSGAPLPPGPNGEQQMMDMPTILPNKDLDDFDVIVKTIRQWGQKNFDKETDQTPLTDDPDGPKVADGFRNVVAYYKMAFTLGEKKAAKAQAAQVPPPKQLPEGNEA